MSRDPLATFYVHTLSVETFLRKSGDGEDVFAPLVICSPLTASGVFIVGERKEVRTGTGELQLSNTTVFGPTSLFPLFVLDSRVTIDGVASRVIATSSNDLDSRFLEHMEVHLA